MLTVLRSKKTQANGAGGQSSMMGWGNISKWLSVSSEGSETLWGPRVKGRIGRASLFSLTARSLSYTEDTSFPVSIYPKSALKLHQIRYPRKELGVTFRKVIQIHKLFY